MATTKPEYKVIGTRPVRHDGVDKVTGRAQYGADIRLTGTLQGAMLRSPHAHAKIVDIDISKAAAMPGVRAVVTNADLPEIGSKIADLGEGMFDLADLKNNVLAADKVLYKGHAVAAVAADDIHTAREAVQLINVQYDILEPVLDVRKAMSADAPLLHAEQRTTEIGDPDFDAPPSNIAKIFRHEKGDPDQGFADAKVVVEKEFTTATVHQGYIEPHNATAHWNADGHVTCWTSTQGSFTVREQLCGLLQVPLSHIKVVPMEIGGGFGGKIVVYLPPVAALLSKKTGKPVKIVMDRAAVLEATGPTPGSWMRIKLGVDANGLITAGDAEIAFEAGAFKGSPVPAACQTVFACYDVPNGQVKGYDVCVNKPATKAYRAPGSTHAAFALETVIDEVCRELDICPIEFRLKNSAKEGTRRVDGPAYKRIGMWESVDAIKQCNHFQTPVDKSTAGEKSPNGLRGRGCASGFWFNAGMKSSVTATVNADGKVALVEGSTDIGGSRAGLAMQMAEKLGIDAFDVIPTVADTDSVGYTDVTGGSRVTYSTGIAVFNAAVDIQNQMVDRAAMIWETERANVRYENGALHGPDGKSLSFREVASQAFKAGEVVIGRGASNASEPGGAFGTHLVDVEVDPDTGKVEILRYSAAQDCGTAIHPDYVEGQIQGGVVQGIGWALNEEYVYDSDGQMANATFLDYRMPTAYDVPMIDPIIVEVPNPGHPYGVRGVGEVPIVPPPAAIANAIFDAVGIRMQHLPMSPPKVLHELLKK